MPSLSRLARFRIHKPCTMALLLLGLAATPAAAQIGYDRGGLREGLFADHLSVGRPPRGLVRARGGDGSRPARLREAGTPVRATGLFAAHVAPGWPALFGGERPGEER